MRFTLPLLHDRHTHVSFYAALGGAADLSGCATREDALALLRRRRGALVTARGWKDNLYSFEGGAADRLGPLAVANISLHSFYFNKPARAMLAEKYPDIAAGLDDQVWTERNLNRIFGVFVAAGGGAAIPAYMAGLAKLGVWAADDMLAADDDSVRTLREKFCGRSELWSEPACWRRLGPAARAAVTGFKIFTDGALGARTAALSRGYRGGGRGLLLHTDEDLARLVKAAARLKGRLAVHAIGDAALAQLLRVLGKLRPSRRELYLRIEHAQLITKAQALRAKKLGLALCMQPNFSLDSRDYADRLPAACLRANNPFRMLIDEAGFVPGEDLVFGSDGMPHGAQAALEAALFPPFSGQRLSPEEFRSGYCLPDEGPGRLEVVADGRRRKVGVKVLPARGGRW